MDESIARASKKVNERECVQQQKNGVSFFWMLLFSSSREYNVLVYFNTLHMNAHQLSSNRSHYNSVFVCCLFVMEIDIVFFCRSFIFSSFLFAVNKREQNHYCLSSSIIHFHFYEVQKRVKNETKRTLHFGSAKCETAKFCYNDSTHIVIRPLYVSACLRNCVSLLYPS